MKNPRRWTEWLVVLLIFGALVGTFINSELARARAANPVGKFTNVGEFLAQGRPATRVTKVQVKTKTYWVAYTPIESGWSVPSGPAAYVFDQSGTLIDWTGDSGDDDTFAARWPFDAPMSSLDELRTLE